MNIEVSILAAIGAMVCWGIGDFFIQRSIRDVGDLEALAFIGIIGTIGLLPLVINDLPLLFSAQNLALLALLGVVTFVAAMFDFEALKKGKLSVIEVIFEIELPITAMLGILLFKETLSLAQLAIMAVIFLGIIMMAAKSLSPKKLFKKVEKGVFLGLIGAVGMSFVNFLTAAGSKQVSPLMAVWVPWIVFTIMSMIIIVKREGLPKMIKNAKKYKIDILGMGVLDTMAWLLYATALLQNELALTTAITESYPAIGLLLGVWINKETVLKHQFLGAGIALAASITLAFFI